MFFECFLSWGFFYFYFELKSAEGRFEVRVGCLKSSFDGFSGRRFFLGF